MDDSFHLKWVTTTSTNLDHARTTVINTLPIYQASRSAVQAGSHRSSSPHHREVSLRWSPLHHGGATKNKHTDLWACRTRADPLALTHLVLKWSHTLTQNQSHSAPERSITLTQTSQAHQWTLQLDAFIPIVPGNSLPVHHTCQPISHSHLDTFAVGHKLSLTLLRSKGSISCHFLRHIYTHFTILSRSLFSERPLVCILFTSLYEWQQRDSPFTAWGQMSLKLVPYSQFQVLYFQFQVPFSKLIFTQLKVVSNELYMPKELVNIHFWLKSNKKGKIPCIKYIALHKKVKLGWDYGANSYSSHCKPRFSIAKGHFWISLSRMLPALKLSFLMPACHLTPPRPLCNVHCPK